MGLLWWGLFEYIRGRVSVVPLPGMSLQSLAIRSIANTRNSTPSACFSSCDHNNMSDGFGTTKWWIVY